MAVTEVTAKAPASVGNVIVGFDILGLCLSAPFDTVTVRQIPQRGVQISQIDNATSIPLKAELNTAGAALLALLTEHTLPFGFDIHIRKGIPVGSGLGGSAASAVAAIVAANEFLPVRLTKAQKLRYASLGEAVASGAPHADNVAPSLFGGLQLIGSEWQTTSLPLPPEIAFVVLYPDQRLDTKASRAVLQKHFPLQAITKQQEFLAHFLVGCYTNCLETIGKSLKDVLIEPRRADLIDGFHQIQMAALEAGALGCSISGGGPSIVAVCKRQDQQRIQLAMLAASAKTSGTKVYCADAKTTGAYVEHKQ